MLLAATVISSGAACRYGADGKRFDDTLSREISHRNATRTIRGGDFSTPLRFGRNDGDGGRLFYNLRPRGRHHHPLNPLNLLTPLNLHAEGVSNGASP